MRLLVEQGDLRISMSSCVRSAVRGIKGLTMVQFLSGDVAVEFGTATELD
jgi:hypothetical protein